MADDGVTDPDPEEDEDSPHGLWDRLARERPAWPATEAVPASGSTPHQPAPHAAGSSTTGSTPQQTADPVTGGTETGAHVVVGEPEDSPAVRQIKRWVARRSRTQVVALVLVSLLAFGPLFALVMILRADTHPASYLVSTEMPDPDVTQVSASFTSLSTNQGEMRARITVTPAPDLLDEDGRLHESVSVVANGTVTELRAGDSVRPFEVTLAVTEGSVTRYPFDRYNGQLVLYITTGAGEDREFLPYTPELRSVVGDFSLDAELKSDPARGDQPFGVVAWTAVRPATTSVYAIWLMVLMWALAVTGLLIVWSVIMWMVELPMWVFGYFVGVLFALPPLRDSLPGRPPPGNLFDFLSFYWSITIIGVSLILSLSTWLTRTRAENRLRELDTGRHETIE